MNAVRKQNIASATAPKRVKIPSAIAIPAKSCRTIVATNTTLGTPIFEVAEAAPSKFNIRKTPSWMKMKASRSRAASSNALRGRPVSSKAAEVIGVLPGRWKRQAWSRPPLDVGSVGCRFAGDRSLQILALVAACWAELRQRRELLLRLVDVSRLDIELAEIFARCLVVGLQVESLGVIRERGRVVARLAKCEAEQIVDVGVLGVFGEIAQFGQGALVVLGLYLCAHWGQVDIATCLHIVHRAC